MAAYSCYGATKETKRGDMLIVLWRCRYSRRRDMYGQRPATILAAMSRENHSTLCDMAFRTSETVVLEARDSLAHHIQQNPLSPARRKRDRSHSDQQPPVERLFLGEA